MQYVFVYNVYVLIFVYIYILYTEYDHISIIYNIYIYMLVANLGAAVAHPYAHLLISGINVPGVVTSTFLLSSFQKFF